ncbi:MAG: IS30 family transposase, partial [Clostridia bacterium]
ALAAYIEERIVQDRYSPAAVLGEIAAKGLTFSVTICPATLYSYIDKGVFLRLSNRNLPVKGCRKRKYNHVRRAARAPRGKSIEHRPESINARSVFGHWEMDCVEGKKSTKRTLLMLTERKTRKEIVIPMRNQTSASVVAALDRLERKYGRMFPRVFESITVDNGSEFADCAGMERSIYGGQRTKVYCCHPYCASERGSNENQNRMFRRHFPKGTDFRRITVKQIKFAEDWMNNYPRKQFNYHTSQEQFEKHMDVIKDGVTPRKVPRRHSSSLT